ncbi:hypothetical protein FPZ42_07745 [Mucilaginibacter achroorhodeus]|uniref:Uncharacterized protein n=1 Tax=Mucilaginibacter achroorhodeus TaxID=2599294 RepID=A0A563U6I2_9SPHI|nr:hypothetical protein [Mucilaginibacter achroorhodeus]TWR26919.1 hypothetical protein FPZ42_07745 [Mucilaginibacter achroorhodeus]
MKKIKVNSEDVFTPVEKLMDMLDTAQNEFNEALSDLDIITQLLELAHPQVIKPYIKEFLEGFHIVETDRLAQWIDKVIHAVCEVELYETAADLLKIKEKVC